MNKIKTRADLFREYARVIDLCEGTKVMPYECVLGIRGPEPVNFNNDPAFTSKADEYKFAIAIVEDKPVFIGDVLYHKAFGEYIVEDVEEVSATRVAFRTINGNKDGDWIEHYSWNQPKPDYYAELKQAQKDGKRIAFLDGTNTWVFSSTTEFEYPPERYKIAEDDIVKRVVMASPGFDGIIIDVTKSGLDGKLTAEVIQ